MRSSMTDSDQKIAGQMIMRPLQSRRRAIVALSAAGFAAVWAPGVLARQDPATPATPTTPNVPPTTGSLLGEASMPDWRFAAVNLSDPYEGTLTKPAGVSGGVRVVALEVSLANESDQPFEFSITDIRLRDTDGIEYRAGDYLGTNPRLVSQNLPNGEITRGWVWFGIPEESSLASIVFVAPPPTLRISL